MNRHMRKKRVIKSMVAAILTIALSVTNLPSTMLGWLGMNDADSATTVQAASGWTKEPIPTTGGSTLYSNRIYTVTETTTITGGTGKNGLQVASGATVIIYIKAGKTLTVKGGNGSGSSAGMAGIYVPSNATLIVTGGGILKASGGTAGNGGTGEGGGNGTISLGSYYQGGYGGAGGSGGGGAGAGIGGNGGSGGSGGSRQSGTTVYSGSDNANGISGNSGSSGNAAGSSGTIYVVGSVNVMATGGSSGSGNGRMSAGNYTYVSGGWSGKNHHIAGGGGAGGGGGGGAAAKGIGSGGGGGAGGGSGGSGGTDYRESSAPSSSWPTNQTCNGGGGSGGAGGGTSGYGTRDTGSSSDAWKKEGGSGASGGSSVGGSGSSGYLYVATIGTVNATINNSTYSNTKRTITSETSLPAALKSTVTYINGKLSESNTITKDVYIGYEMKTPEESFRPDNFTGYEFQGFYTAQNGGGVRVIDENGQVITGTAYTDGSSWLYPGDLTLYAYYKPKTYTLTLSSEGAEDHGATSTEVTYDQAVASTLLQIPLKKNSVFLGYYTGENGTGTQLIDGTGAFVTDERVAEYMNSERQWVYDGDLTLYANWLSLGGMPVTSEVLKMTLGAEDAVTYYYGEVSTYMDGSPYETDRVELKKENSLYRMSEDGDGNHSIAVSQPGIYQILVDGIDTGHTLELSSTDESNPSKETIYGTTVSVTVNIDHVAYNNGLVELKDGEGNTAYTAVLDQEGTYTCVGFFLSQEDDTPYHVYVDGKNSGETVSFREDSKEVTIDYYSFHVLTMLDDAVSSLDGTLTLVKDGETILPDSAVGGSYSYLGRDEDAVYEIYLGDVFTGKTVSANGTAVIKYYTTTIQVTADGMPCDATDIYLYEDGTPEEDIESAKLTPVRTDTGVYKVQYAAKDTLYHICVNGQEYERTVNFIQKNTVNAAFVSLRVMVNKDGAAFDPEGGVTLKAGSIRKVLNTDSTGNYYTYVYSTEKTVYDVITGVDETGMTVSAASPACTVDYYTLTLDVGNGTLDDSTSYVQLKGSTLGLSDKIPTCVDPDYPDFAGWYESADGTGEPITEYTFSDTKTLYARYSKGLVPYTVNYYVPNMEGNDPEYVLAAREDGTIEIGKTLGMSGEDENPDVLIQDQLAEGGDLYGMHLLFDHSSLDEQEDGMLIAERSSTNTIDVYCKYEQIGISYAVTGEIAANEALAAAMNEATKDYNYGTVVTLLDPLAYMEEDHYVVDGWKDESGNYYTSGQKVTLTENLTLTSSFEESYTVTYRQNGGNVGFTTEPQAVYNEETGEYGPSIVYNQDLGVYVDATTGEPLTLETEDQVFAVAKDSTVEIGLDSQKDGLILSGWWLLNEEGEKTDTFFDALTGSMPTYTVRSDTTLQARWIATITQPSSRLYRIVSLEGFDPDDVEEGEDYSFYIDYVGYSYMTDEGYVATSSVENATESQMNKLTPETRTITVDGQEKEVQVYTISDVTACQYLTVSGVKYKVKEGSVTVGAIPAQEYEGQQLKPDITVTSVLGDMTEGEDYTLSYGPNVWTGAGNAGSITITGIGDYIGDYTIYFDIVDTAVPTVTAEGEGITVSTSTWRSLLNAITFGHFFHETENVIIKADDLGSGVETISYFLSESDRAYTKTELESDSTMNWQEYHGTFQISPEFKGVIYARITDKAGNTLYINSEGLVFFLDSVFDTGKVTYIREDGRDAAITGTLHNNTVGKVTLTPVEEGQEEGNPITLAVSDYSVNESGITIKGSRLDDLIVGNYRVEITVLPLGVQTENAQKFAVPLEVIEKTEVEISGLTAKNFTEGDNETGLTGTPVCMAGGLDVTALCGTLIYTYKGTGDTTYEETTVAPTEKGTYQVTVSVPDGNKYRGSAIYYFEIREKMDVAGTLTWNYQYEYDEMQENGSCRTLTIIAGANGENEISRNAKVQLLNHGIPVEGVDPVSVTAVMTEGSLVGELYTKAGGTYEFRNLPAYVEGVEASYSVSVTPTVAADGESGEQVAADSYYVTLNGVDADIYYIPETGSYDVSWSITIRDIETIEQAMPDTVYAKILCSDSENGSFEAISQMQTNHGMACALTSQGDGTYAASGIYPVRRYLDGSIAYYKVQVVGYDVNGKYIDVSAKNFTSQQVVFYDADADAGTENLCKDVELTIDSLPVPVLVLDGNGGTASLSYILKDSLGATATAAELNGVTISRDYYDFLGWYTDAQCLDSAKVTSGVTVDTKTIVYAGYLDNTPPTGTIQVASSKWKEIINTITFGLFFKNSQTVTIVATDRGDGIETVSYYLHTDDGSEGYRALTVEELDGLQPNQWTPGTSVNINPDIRTTVYARLVDKAGNTSYISTEGMIFDETAPVITGIVDQQTYYKSVTFTVTESNAENFKVYVDGQEVVLDGADSYAITPDGQTHTIRAVDGAGNTSPDYRITVKDPDEAYEEFGQRYDDLPEPEPEMDEDGNPVLDENGNPVYQPGSDVTSEDKDEIEKLLDDIDQLLDDADDELSQEQKDQLEEMKRDLEEKKQALDELEEELESLDERYQNIPEESGVTGDDRDDIEELIDDLDDFLNDHAKNLTDDEREELEQKKQELEERLEKLDEVEEELSDISEKKDNLPTLDPAYETDENGDPMLDEFGRPTVIDPGFTDEDKEKYEDLLQEVKDVLSEYYDNLTDDQKQELEDLVDDLEEKLDQMRQIEEYMGCYITITKQPGDSTITEGGSTSFTVEATSDYELYYQWYVDRGDGLGWQIIAGSTASTHTTDTGLTMNCNGYQYKCIVSNVRGSIESEAAKLTITAAPTTGDDEPAGDEPSNEEPGSQPDSGSEPEGGNGSEAGDNGDTGNNGSSEEAGNNGGSGNGSGTGGNGGTGNGGGTGGNRGGNNSAQNTNEDDSNKEESADNAGKGTNILDLNGITEDQAKELISSDDASDKEKVLKLLGQAIEAGNVRAVGTTKDNASAADRADGMTKSVINTTIAEESLESLIETALTDEEKLSVLSGETVRIRGEMIEQTNEELLSGYEDAAKDNLPNGMKVASFLESAFFKQIGDQNEERINGEAKAIVTFEIPESLRSTDGEVILYQVMRIYTDEEGNICTELIDISQEEFMITMEVQNNSQYVLMCNEAVALVRDGNPVEKTVCHWHYLMLLLMLAYILFVFLYRRRNIKVMGIVFAVDVLLTILVLILGSCTWDIGLAIGTLVVEVAAEPARIMISKAKLNNTDSSAGRF